MLTTLSPVLLAGNTGLSITLHSKIRSLMLNTARADDDNIAAISDGRNHVGLNIHIFLMPRE